MARHHTSRTPLQTPASPANPLDPPLRAHPWGLLTHQFTPAVAAIAGASASETGVAGPEVVEIAGAGLAGVAAADVDGQYPEEAAAGASASEAGVAGPEVAGVAGAGVVGPEVVGIARAGVAGVGAAAAGVGATAAGAAAVADVDGAFPCELVAVPCTQEW